MGNDGKRGGFGEGGGTEVVSARCAIESIVDACLQLAACFKARFVFARPCVRDGCPGCAAVRPLVTGQAAC